MRFRLWIIEKREHGGTFAGIFLFVLILALIAGVFVGALQPLKIFLYDVGLAEKLRLTDALNFEWGGDELRAWRMYIAVEWVVALAFFLLSLVIRKLPTFFFTLLIGTLVVLLLYYTGIFSQAIFTNNQQGFQRAFMNVLFPCMVLGTNVLPAAASALLATVMDKLRKNAA